MSWLAFIASVIKSLAWPVAIVVLVIVLRKQLASLFAGLAARLANLRKLSAMGVDLEFETRVEEVSREAEQLAPAVEKPPPEPEADVTSLLKRLADIDPRAAVVMAFTNVEGALRRAAKRAIGADNAPVHVLLRKLQEQGLITDVPREVFDELRSLRSKAVHGTEFVITKPAADQYVDVATMLIQSLDSIGTEAG